MKTLRARLMEARRQTGAPWEVLERDYLLSWVLAGVEQVDSLRDALVFKGGTALKKCYFGNYRFSKDLDFSGTADVPTGPALQEAMADACRAAVRLCDEYAPLLLTCERYTERSPHPGGQEAFSIRARFPWQREAHTRVMVEVSVDEAIHRATPRKMILHEYGEPLRATVLVYALDEIIAEKLRAILQHMARLAERGWSRSRARDYYDLWRVLGAFREQLDLRDFRSLLHAKCAARGVSFVGPGDFFQGKMLSLVEATWVQWLDPLVPALPPYEKVVSELRIQVEELLE